MKYEFDTLSNIRKHFIASLVTKLREEGKEKENKFLVEFSKDRSLEIDVKINGFEMDPFAFLDSQQNFIEKYTEEKAQELIKEKLSEIFNDIEEYGSVQQRMERALCEKIGISYKEEW
jgi:hypothetical protein